MRKLYQLNWKLYLKTIYLPAAYLLLLGYGGYLFSNFITMKLLMPFQNSLTGVLAQLGMLCFTFFLFEAYEFLHKSGDRDLRESLRSINSGERKTVASQLLVLFSLVLLTFLLAAAVVFVTAQGVNPMPPAALGNAMLAVVLYLLCPMLIAVLIGAVGALCISRLPFYFLALLIVFLTSEFSDVFTIAAGFQTAEMLGTSFGIFVSRLTGLFRNLTLSTFIFSDMAYGLSMEPFHWALVLFWVGLCLALLCWMLRRRKGLLMRILSGAFAVVCVFGLWGYANPGSNWRSATRISVEANANSDAVYYGDTEAAVQQNETKPAGFSVTDYVLDLSFWKDLSATATLTLDGTQLPEYDFTLYHGYTVRSVTDGEGNPLSYERWHDYLRVKAPEGAALTTVRIAYSGYHLTYYSSMQGAFLPGFFPYYPMEGLFPVMEEGDIYYTIPAQEAERNFTIQVNSPCEAFSNLSGKDGNTLTGKAKYLTIVAGMYEEKDFEGDHIIAPYGTDVFEIGSELEERMAHLSEVSGVTFTAPALEKVIYAPNLLLPMNNEQPVFLDDTLLYYRNPYMEPTYAAEALAPVAAEQCVPEALGKELVRGAYIEMVQSVLAQDDAAISSFVALFGKNIEGDYKVVQDFSEEENAAREVRYYLYKALLGSDAPTIFRAVNEYLTDDSDTTDQLAFVKALAEQYPVKEVQ